MNLCLGTVQFGFDYGIQENGKPNIDAIYDILNISIDNGIMLFDTASAYGDAERVLGQYLTRFPKSKDKIEIVSKLNPNAFLCSEVKSWKNIAIEEAKKSLDIIGVSKFYAYLFHNASSLYDDDAILALSQIKEMGLSKKVGVSIYTPEEAMKALEYSVIEVIQIPYNVFDRRLDNVGFFDIAKEKGVEIFARSSLLQGLIMMNPNELPKRVLFAKEFLIKYLSICNEYNYSPLEVAIGYVSQKNGIDYVVFGVDSLEQLEEYISIKGIKLPDVLIDELDMAFCSVEEKLVNPSMWKE